MPSIRIRPHSSAPDESRGMPTIGLTPSPVHGTSQGLNAYLAKPTRQGPWAGAVLVHEIFGLDDAMREHADRLAGAGYLTIAPDLFTEGGPRRCLRATFASLRTGEGRAYRDIEAARQWLVAQDACTGRVGVIGFCMGGGFALMTAAGSGFSASSVNYGALPADPDAALAEACPIVASYGARDRSLKGAAAELESVLTRHGVPHDVKEYAAAGHLFLNDAPVGPRWLQPVFRVMLHAEPEPASAGDAWERIESFFAAHLSEQDG